MIELIPLANKFPDDVLPQEVEFYFNNLKKCLTILNNHKVILIEIEMKRTATEFGFASGIQDPKKITG